MSIKKCSADCSVCCDFCRFYNFNPDHMGSYLGDGYCVFHEVHKDPGDKCEQFICFEYKVKKGRHTRIRQRVIRSCESEEEEKN